jgi:hypothetical protein
MVEILNKVSGAQGKEDDKFSVAKVPLPSFTNFVIKRCGFLTCNHGDCNLRCFPMLCDVITRLLFSPLTFDLELICEGQILLDHRSLTQQMMLFAWWTQILLQGTLQ